MALLVTAKCDKCPNRIEFDPRTDKHHTYEVDDGVVPGTLSSHRTRTVKLPEGWGVLELNVGHDKAVQEICPECVARTGAFMKEMPTALPAGAPEPKALPAKSKRKKKGKDDGDEEA